MSRTVDTAAMDLPPGERGHPMTTFMGVEFWPMDPRPEDMHIIDVAHHLAMQCRFNGAIREFYSVAEHCCIGSDLVYDLTMLATNGDQEAARVAAFEFLMHDAAEAYIGDMIRPIKNGSRCGAEFKLVEDRVEGAVRIRWNLLTPTPAIVKQVDREMCVVEQRARYEDLADFISAAFPDGVTKESVNAVHPHVKPYFWNWQRAKMEFLRRYHDLTDEV